MFKQFFNNAMHIGISAHHQNTISPILGCEMPDSIFANRKKLTLWKISSIMN